MTRAQIMVEDEGIVALDIQSRLQSLGYDAPIIVPSGEEAIKEAEKGHARFESRFKRVDGTIVDVEVSSRVTDAQKEIVQCIVRDCRERKCLEKQVRRLERMRAAASKGLTR